MNDSSRKGRGFCPGVWAPMESGDGLIVRVRPLHARMPAHHLGELARLARRNGNGIIELTRRGNLQIRGVSQPSLPSLQAALVALGLTTPGPEGEARPGLFVCPLSGLDPRSPPLEPLAEALEASLSSTGRRGLSEKFGVVLSGGSRSSSSLSADIHVRLHPAHPGVADVLLAGRADAATPLGACAAADAPEAVRRLLLALAAQPGERRRMRDRVVADLAGLRSTVQHLLCGEARGEAPWGSGDTGFHTGLWNWFGFAVPFGSAHADDWEAIATLASSVGSGEVRFTATRHVLIVGVSSSDREALLDVGDAHGFGTRRGARALELVACSGSPACGSAHGETRQLATGLGALLHAVGGAPATLHVSGCEKSCARDGAADVTLVHGADGLRLGFGRDVRSILGTRPLTLESVREQLSSRLVALRAARPDVAAGTQEPSW